MKHRRTKTLLILLFVIFIISSCKKAGIQTISIIGTTDIHGVILPYDFIDQKPLDVSLAHVSGYVKKLRKTRDAVFLLDNGDNIQGQPSVYYYNYIDTISPHFMSEVFNRMGYDATTAGNHDIEAGHSVYDRLVEEYDFPVLAANAVDKKTGKPYFKPFVIVEKSGIKIAVLGLITPAVPTWLPEELYSGIEFRDMQETAELWMPAISEEDPDLVVGLFHSGWNRENTGARPSDENGSAAVAYNVKGFDLIFTGHDHREINETFINRYGDTILILNGGSRAETIACANVTFKIKGNSEKQIERISGVLADTRELEPDREFIKTFGKQEKIIKEYVSRVIGTSETEISSAESFFGSSAFVDMIHSIQLDLTGADISFAAPLSFNEKIARGPVTVGDMFKLYRFENMLYTIRMTGDEVLRYLEYSYSEWLNPMKGPGDYLLKYRMGKDGRPALTNGRAWLRNQSYNFDSAAGIDYLVDVSRPEGKMVLIKSFSDGRPFIRDEYYDVAVNSYRGNGGGGHLTRGAGIKGNELRKRLIRSTDRDLRYYILKSVGEQKTIDPEPLNNWKIVPEMWVERAREREKLLLFGSTK
ncbi:MAG TPA: bifunctional UDP-sugar hydrolase/5'-nucleotidase [Bacteroidales bacterium]|nr:bifunctional UDP-sugar hydrolase/5'-nucleotidase [Bacteroidales bacterium]HPM87135.1 bifunctional UDP-sugar hydrolase/5'-nucleotidase [Bacteroidales bacterium]HQM67978.1 bifunctional UDP-sugar hydrolase/5'-nucleotidase [Bacteroidales bacterium]